MRVSVCVCVSLCVFARKQELKCAREESVCVCLFCALKKEGRGGEASVFASVCIYVCVCVCLRVIMCVSVLRVYLCVCFCV